MTPAPDTPVYSGFGWQPLARMVQHYWVRRHGDLPFFRRQMRNIISQAREAAHAR